MCQRLSVEMLKLEMLLTFQQLHKYAMALQIFVKKIILQSHSNLSLFHFVTNDQICKRILSPNPLLSLFQIEGDMYVRGPANFPKVGISFWFFQTISIDHGRNLRVPLRCQFKKGWGMSLSTEN